MFPWEAGVDADGFLVYNQRRRRRSRCCVMNRKTFLSVALAALAAFPLLPLGCARHSRAEDAPGGKITLNFWNGFTGPDGKTMEAMVSRFQAENPDVVVKMQLIPWGTYYDKLTLSLAYGGAPEVFVVHAARLPEFASFDVLRPLDSLYASDSKPLVAADFAPVPWAATFYKGRHVALPLDVHPIGLYYNTRLFQDAGIVDAHGQARPPTNWDEFVTDAKKLTKDTDGDGRPDQWGFVFTNQRTNWLTFAGQFGGGIMTADGKRSAMDSPGSLEASRRMRDLIVKYKVASTPEGFDAWLAFRQGKAAMAMEGIYMLQGLEEQKNLAFAGAPVPQFGPKKVVWGGSHLLCQPRGLSENRARAAWRLMRYLSDHSLEWARGGQIPARLAVRNSPEFAALPVQSQFARQLDKVRYEPLIPEDNSLMPFVDPAIESLLRGGQTPEDAMRDASRRINQRLSRP